MERLRANRKKAPISVKGTKVIVNRLVIEDQDVANYLSHMPVDELQEHFREALYFGVISFPVVRAYRILKKIQIRFELLGVRYDQELDDTLEAIERELEGVLGGKGQMGELIEKYFGEGSTVREILYPRRQEIPLHQLVKEFKSEMIELRKAITSATAGKRIQQ